MCLSTASRTLRSMTEKRWNTRYSRTCNMQFFQTSVFNTKQLFSELTNITKDDLNQCHYIGKTRTCKRHTNFHPSPKIKVIAHKPFEIHSSNVLILTCHTSFQKLLKTKNHTSLNIQNLAWSEQNLHNNSVQFFKHNKKYLGSNNRFNKNQHLKILCSAHTAFPSAGFSDHCYCEKISLW